MNEHIETLAKAVWHRQHGANAEFPADKNPALKTWAVWSENMSDDTFASILMRTNALLEAFYPVAELNDTFSRVQIAEIEDEDDTTFASGDSDSGRILLDVFFSRQAWLERVRLGNSLTISAYHINALCKLVDLAESMDMEVKHPLWDLMAAWQNRLVKPGHTHLIVTQKDDLLLARQPAIHALSGATLKAIEVDGQPFVTVLPDKMQRRRWKVAEPLQGELFPGPKTLDGNVTAGTLIDAAAELNFSGDERSPIRGDMARLALVAVALTNPVVLTDAEGAILIAGKNTTKNRERFNRALWAVRSMRFEAKPGIFWSLVDSEPGDANRLGPPRWWLDQTGSRAWRLSGGLFRSATKWGTVERTVAGIEAALTWGPTAGKGKGGRRADYIQPVGKSGPGLDVFIPWWQVLRLSGEPVTAEDNSWGKVGERYRRRVAALKDAEYFTTSRGTAPAGDTIEIVKQVKGGKNHEAGLIVRASARFCAAHTDKNAQKRISGTFLLQNRKKA